MVEQLSLKKWMKSNVKFKKVFGKCGLIGKLYIIKSLGLENNYNHHDGIAISFRKIEFPWFMICEMFQYFVQFVHIKSNRSHTVWKSTLVRTQCNSLHSHKHTEKHMRLVYAAVLTSLILFEIGLLDHQYDVPFSQNNEMC